MKLSSSIPASVSVLLLLVTAGCGSGGSFGSGGGGGGSHGVSPNWGTERAVAAASPAVLTSAGRRIAVSTNGTVHAVWSAAKSGGGYAVYISRSVDQGQTWTAPKQISGAGSAAAEPSIAAGLLGSMHLVWTEIPASGTRKVFYARSTDDGTTWSAAVNISGSPTADAGVPEIGADLFGRLHVVWQMGQPVGASPSQVMYSRSVDGGSTFSTPRRLNGGAKSAVRPRFQVQGTQGFTFAVVWSDIRLSAEGDIFCAVTEDGGNTFTERPVSVTSTRDTQPDLLTDGSGRMHVVWSRSFSGQPAHIWYSRSTDQGRTWSTPNEITTVRSSSPVLVGDNFRGVLWLALLDERDAVNDTDTRADIAIRRSINFGDSWDASEFVTDLGGSAAAGIGGAAASDGRPILIWDDNRTASRPTIYVRRRN